MKNKKKSSAVKKRTKAHIAEGCFLICCHVDSVVGNRIHFYQLNSPEDQLEHVSRVFLLTVEGIKEREQEFVGFREGIPLCSVQHVRSAFL
jgi:hypothetical protein